MRKLFGFSKKFKTLYIILALVFLLSTSCKVILSYLSASHVYIYFNRIVNDEIQQYLLYIMIIAASIFFIITFKMISLKIVTFIACIFLILVTFIFSGIFGESDRSYFEFKSPTNKVVVVEECSWLLGGWSNVYQKMSSNIIIGLNGNISTDEGYRPFSNHDFNLEWSTNSVNITYGFGSESIHKKEVFKLK